MKKRDSKNYLKVILLLIVLLMFPFLSTINNDLFTSILNGDIESIRHSLSGNLLYACILTLILMIIQNTFTIIPLIFVITINYTLFGFIYGFIWGWICSVIAAVVIYMCV